MAYVLKVFDSLPTHFGNKSKRKDVSMNEESYAKKGKPQNPGKGSNKPDKGGNPGKALGKTKIGVCELQDTEAGTSQFEFKLLPLSPGTQKRLAKGQLIAADSPAVCANLNDALVTDEEEEVTEEVVIDEEEVV